jgi:hypothetical protein
MLKLLQNNKKTTISGSKLEKIYTPYKQVSLTDLKKEDPTVSKQSVNSLYKTQKEKLLLKYYKESVLVKEKYINSVAGGKMNDLYSITKLPAHYANFLCECMIPGNIDKILPIIKIKPILEFDDVVEQDDNSDIETIGDKIKEVVVTPVKQEEPTLLKRTK